MPDTFSSRSHKNNIGVSGGRANAKSFIGLYELNPAQHCEQAQAEANSAAKPWSWLKSVMGDAYSMWTGGEIVRAIAYGILILLATMQQGLCDDIRYVRNDIPKGELTLRSGPGLNNYIVASIPAEQAVDLMGACRDDHWCPVIWNNKVGWLMESGLTRARTSGDRLNKSIAANAFEDEAQMCATHFVTFKYTVRQKNPRNELAMRSRPNHASPEVLEVSSGSILKFLGECELETISSTDVHWCRYEYDHQEGWLPSAGVYESSVQPANGTHHDCGHSPPQSLDMYECILENSRGNPTCSQNDFNCEMKKASVDEQAFCAGMPLGTREYSACDKRWTDMPYQFLDRFKSIQSKCSKYSPKHQTWRSIDKEGEKKRMDAFLASHDGSEDEKLRAYIDLSQKEDDDARSEVLLLLATPTWHPLLDSISRSDGAAPSSARQVFVNSSPSVYQISGYEQNTSSDPAVFGSAVAVTPNQLLTNCHVIKGMAKIVVKDLNTETEMLATVSAADFVNDRCVIETNERVRPVKTLRSMSSLQIGERVYSIGNPKELSLTLGEGLVSGIRRNRDITMVQTTAQISPGSSGGALFDESGALVGITTLMLRESQALNFAIAAEEFCRE